MAVESGDTDDVRAMYFDSDSPAELFSAAAAWAAKHDGGFSIEALAWKVIDSPIDGKYELAIFFDPTG